MNCFASSRPSVVRATVTKIYDRLHEPSVCSTGGVESFTSACSPRSPGLLPLLVSTTVEAPCKDNTEPSEYLRFVIDATDLLRWSEVDDGFELLVLSPHTAVHRAVHRPNSYLRRL